MKTLTIVTIVVLALCSMASGGQLLSVNGEQTETIILKVGQLCSVEVSSDNTIPYNAYVGFDYGAVGGVFSHSSTQNDAGALGSNSPYSDINSNFEGYFITAAGSGLAAGVHFNFSYTPDAVGQTELKLYDISLFTVIDSVSITVVADEMGTAFTYRGRLVDTDAAADGLYDFQFNLYDSPSDGELLASAVILADVNVSDGYFTVELDFGSAAFAGDGIWLDVSVRAGGSDEGTLHTQLSPRQKITPAPYAIYAAGSDWNNLTNIPADIANGDDDTDTVLAESQVEFYIANDITTGYLPYDNGTKLADSGLSSDGSNIGLGTTAVNGRKFSVYTDIDTYAMYSNAAKDSGYNYGLYASATGNTSGVSYGVSASSASKSGTNYGLFASAIAASSGTNFGIYASGRNAGTGDAFAGFFTGAVHITGGLNQGGDLRIATNEGAEVTIGTTGYNIEKKLYVYTDSDTYSVYAENANTAGSSYAVYGTATTSSSGANFGVYGKASNSGSGAAYAGYFLGTLRVVGDITYTGSISDTSDIRLKENIVPLENAGEKISALKAIYFNNKGESPDNREIGVIAQDVEKVLPELVTTNQDGYKAVDYTKLTPVLIEAVKELMAENELLKRRLDAMEEKLSDKYN